MLSVVGKYSAAPLYSEQKTLFTLNIRCHNITTVHMTSHEAGVPMLTHLSVRHIATVEKLDLDLESGLTCVSGETGAGKSVILDALGLALGNRADAGIVRHGHERAEVIATFDIHDNHSAKRWLMNNELDDQDECLLRRVVRKDGRSRAYINGSACGIGMVRELGELLISIHSQNEHQALLKKETHRKLLDQLANSQDHARNVKKAWLAWQDARKAHDQALESAKAQTERQDLLRFQLEELNELALQAGELEQLENEQKKLSSADLLIGSCQKTLLQLFDGEDNTCNDQLGQAGQWLEDAAQHDQALLDIASAVNLARIHVESAADDLRHYLDRMDTDPARLQEVEDRLSQCYTLARKYRIRPEELAAHYEQLQSEALTLENFDQHLDDLAAAEQSNKQEYFTLAKELSRQRAKAADNVSADLRQSLIDLGMPNAELGVTLSPHDGDGGGLENVEFCFSANPGQPLQPLSKVASGGELSRVSLAIQVLFAQSIKLPTMVFDEVDVGVGGAVAEVVGRLLRQLGHHGQVLCITHQAQVASQGHQHWLVHKLQSDNTTHTRINALDTSARTEELARMLGGVNITESTRRHAKEMLTHGQTAA